jgi:hypothetical protein
MGTEAAVLNQLKKGQGETNALLERLIAEMAKMNEQLAELTSSRV